jgi:hypothetical protein
VDIKTETNPYQKEAYGDAKKFADSLADRSHESITNAMQRTRDVGAGALADVAANAGRRGGGPGSGLAGVLGQRTAAENTRQVAKTNADLTDVALGREGQARAIEMGGATDIAKDMTDMFGEQADLHLGTRRADLDRGRYYAEERDRRYDRARDIAELALRYGGEGATGGGTTGGGGGAGAFNPTGRSTPVGGGGLVSPSAPRSTSTYSDFGSGHPFAGLR